MKSYRRWLLLALPLALAACGGGEGEGDTAAATDTASAARPAESTAAPTPATMPSTVALQAVGTSGVTGQATLIPGTGQTQVQVQLSALTPGVHPGHIHAGTCAAIGPVVHPLPNVTAGADGSGSADGSVAVDAATILNGQHVISYHGAGDEIAPVTCGELVAHPM